MQRRDVLKGFSAAMGGALLPRTAWTLPLPPAVAIRGLVRREGKLLQPIRIALPQAKAGAQVVTKVDGTTVDHRTLPEGAESFDVFFDLVTPPGPSGVGVRVKGANQTAEVERKPVRKVLVYVLPHSHHDLGYTDLQADVEEKQINNILEGMELARKTEHYPEGARFVWNLEVLWGADLFLKRRPESDRIALREAVRKGWIGLNGSYANELTGLCRPEELLQLFRFGTRLGKDYGVPIRSAMMSDVPGFSWGTVMAMSQAGIRYFSAAPNYFDRIGTFMVAWQDKPFWWLSPSGKEKVLFWVPWTGYAMSHVMKLGDEFVANYQNRMDDVHYPYDITYIRWSGHGDNAEPDPELSEFIRAWNEKYEWPRFAISSTSTAFSAFEKRYGNQLPQYRGDLTPYWEDGAASSALETAMNRNAAERIVQAGALSAIDAPNSYVPSIYEAAWRDVLLYSEHTWGAWSSVSDSESPFTKKQWAVKREFAVDADKTSNDLLNGLLNPSASSTDASQVEIHNATSWDRTEIVYLSRDLSVAGDHVIDHKGKPVPSQRLSTGELAVLVTEVPAFGIARYTISAKKAHNAGAPASVKDGVLENGLIRVKVDPATGNIIELNLHGSSQNLV